MGMAGFASDNVGNVMVCGVTTLVSDNVCNEVMMHGDGWFLSLTM